MAIQFACPGCQQPIEVDAEHAGRMATCPYCHRVVTVPLESTYQPESVAPARPAALPDSGSGVPRQPYQGETGLHVGPAQTPGRRAARIIGGYALACVVLALVLFVTVIVVTDVAVLQKHPLWSTTQSMSLDQMKQLQPEFEKEMESRSWLRFLWVGGELFFVLGLALGAVSVFKSRRGNWMGIVAVTICAGMLLCICASVVLTVMLRVGR